MDRAAYGLVKRTIPDMQAGAESRVDQHKEHHE
jgi:hypothetical protein